MIRDFKRHKKILPQRSQSLERSLCDLCGQFFLKELYSIPKRVAKFESFVPGNRYAIQDIATRAGEFFPPHLQVRDKVRRMRLRFRPVDAVLSSKMDLRITELQPKSATAGKRFGFWYLDQTEDTTVKGTSLVLGCDRNADLDVMYGLECHSALLSRMRASTAAGMSPSILPPSSNTCFIRVDETYEYSSPAIKKTVSIEGSRRRFMSAIRSSYS